MQEKKHIVRGKVVQRMTRDGLAQSDLATGTTERISQKETSVKFGGHEREQALSGRPVRKAAEGRFSFKYKAFEQEGGASRSNLRFSEKELVQDNLAGEAEAPEHATASEEMAGGTRSGRLQYSRLELEAEKVLDAGEPPPIADELPGAAGAGPEDPLDFGHVKGWMLPKPTPWQQSYLWKSGKWTAQKAGQAGRKWLHQKIKEGEADNAGVQAGHMGERILERGGTALYRRYKKRKARLGKRYAKLEQKTNKAQIKADKARIRLERYQGSGGGSRASGWRGMQKKHLQRKHAAAVRRSEKVSEQFAKETEKVAKKATNIMIEATKKIIQFISTLVSWAFMILGTIVSIVLFGVILAVIVYFVFSMFTVATSYLADDQDIHDASVLVTQLEAELDKTIYDTPTDPQWSYSDEFRYDLDPIGHNPFVLMAWMTAKFDDFKFEEKTGFLNELHNARYDLRFEVEEEIRTYTDEDGDEHEYTYYILNVILRSKTIEQVIEPEMALDPTGDLRDRYDVLMESKGNRQLISNPFDFDWTSGYSSIYGHRIDPLGGGQLQFHRGLDIPMSIGTPIKSGVTGTVIDTGYNDTFGNYIVITDKKGEVQVKYAHCDQLNLAAGAEIKASETVIATVGNTGGSTGGHVHIEVKVNGAYQNPIYAVGWETPE